MSRIIGPSFCTRSGGGRRKGTMRLGGSSAPVVASWPSTCVTMRRRWTMECGTPAARSRRCDEHHAASAARLRDQPGLTTSSDMPSARRLPSAETLDLPQHEHDPHAAAACRPPLAQRAQSPRTPDAGNSRFPRRTWPPLPPSVRGSTCPGGAGVKRLLIAIPRIQVERRARSVNFRRCTKVP